MKKNAKYFLRVAEASQQKQLDDEAAEKKQREGELLNQIKINEKWWRTEGVESMLERVRDRSEDGRTNTYLAASNIPKDVIRIFEKLGFKIDLEYNDILISWGK